MTLAQDKARRINTPLSILHHLWVADMLGIPYKFRVGVDLYDPQTRRGVEVKFSKVEESPKDITWTIDRKQLAYIDQCNDFFWACGIHYPRRPVHTMLRFLSTTLEKNISFRELYLVKSGWVPQTVQFKLTQGRSRTKEWSSYLGYASFVDLPPVASSYRVRKGVIHFTEGVPEEKFCVEGRKIS